MPARSLTGLVIVLALLLSACGSPSTPAPAAPSQAGSPAPGSAATTEASPRRAALSELLNEVLARASGAGEIAPASEGQVLELGGLVRTGADSKARIDLTEGTIVRLAAMSEFTVSEINDDASNPFTRLSLAAGKVWVILNGGSLDVETPVGVATVRGSYLGVDFYPEYKVLVVTCLEGRCALQNDQGQTDLTDGQAASIAGEGQPPSGARPMTGDEVQEWTQDNPEAVEVIPTPEPTAEATDEATTEVTLEGTPGAAPPPEETPPPPPILDPDRPRTQPLSYDIKNECATEGAGAVTFDGPVTVLVDIPPGERRSGELPPGIYSISVSLPDVNAAFGPYPADSDVGPVAFSLCGDQPPGSASVGGGGGPFTYTLTNNCPESMGTFHLTFTGPETRTVDIPLGQTVSGELPPGDYTVSVRADDGMTDGPFPMPREAWPIVRGTCDGGPPPGGGSPPPPGTPFPGGTPFTPGPDGPHVNTQPLRYNLNYNCPPDMSAGTWVWTFQRLDEGQAFTVELQPGESKSGELPPGRYSVSDRDATGPLASAPALDSDFTTINVSRCP
jgi:hypothetical protein